MIADVLEAGDVVADRYRIDATLGRGGMGAVYRGFDLGLRRPVAIKVLAPQLRGHATPNQRMAREAFATARVAHPNCVTVLDSGALDDGSVFLAMELLEGRDLANELADGRIDQRRALGIATHVLRGLAHAHDAGVIHRDIKPANIYLIGARGEPDFAKLLDFGIAKLIGDARTEAGAVTLTQEGLAIGSPVYMSPEQAIGNPLDARSDLYSLSVVLFEMITGRPPFDDEDKIAVLRMHLARPAPRLVDVAPDLSPLPGLEELLARCLDKDPAARVQSAREYLDAIDAIVQASYERTPIPSVSPATPTPSPGRMTAPTKAAIPLAHAPTQQSNPVIAPIALAAAPRRSPARRYVLIGAVALGLCAVLAIVTTGDDPPATSAPPVEAAAPVAADEPEPARDRPAGVVEPKDDEGDELEIIEPAAPEPDEPVDLVDPLGTEIAEINALRRARRLREASSRAKALLKRHPDSAGLHMAYGHVFFDKMWWSDGFDHYRRAIELDPELRRIPSVTANAVRALSSRSKPWLAERFIRDVLGELAVPALEHAAQSRSRNLRYRANRLLSQIRRR